MMIPTAVLCLVVLPIVVMIGILLYGLGYYSGCKDHDSRLSSWREGFVDGRKDMQRECLAAIQRIEVK